MTGSTGTEPGASDERDRGDDAPGPGAEDASKAASDAGLATETTEPANRDGPVDEADALRLLTSGSEDAAERAEAAQAAALADLITERLQKDASGLRIGTLALFQDTVSFGGGFTVGGGPHGSSPSAVQCVPIEEDQQDAHITDFVPPAHYTAMLESLRASRLLILAVPPGTGREACAVNLLAEALAEDGAGTETTCHRVTDPVAVLSPGWKPHRKYAGYVTALDETDTEATRALNLNQLTSTAAALKSADCFMVVVTGPPRGALARAADRSSYVWRELGALDPYRIVERRVLGTSPDESAFKELQRVLASSGARDLLREQPQPDIAARVSSALRAGRDLAAEVARMRDPSDQVHQWFVRHDNPAAVCFALAAAVLEGSGYLTVADAAWKLYAAVTTDLGASPAPSPVALRFSDRLAHEQPWIVVDPPAAGKGGPPQVRFRSPLLRQTVLTYAWTSLDGYRGLVVDWLRQLLFRGRDTEVRAKAAVAAGVLAWSDPQHALHRYLRSWAGSQSWPLRQGAATALSVVAGRPEHSAWAWDLLDAWVTPGGSAADRRLAKTAATAVGGLLGRQDPRRAMDVLRTALGWRDDWANLLPVAWSAVHLIDQGCGRDVLSAFLQWSAPQDRSPMVSKTLSAFLFTALQPGSDTGASGARRSAPLPYLLARCSHFQPQLEELWARSLARRPVQDRALEALRTWVTTYGNGDRDVLGSLGPLITGIARRPGKHRDRLDYYLGQWAADPDRPSPAAAELLHAVRRLP
ncbi:hypothetical protein [Streptomyces sioyaensis]|uniref:hypothetical protein n=1 Tax=Streptomyces sioyaensis TaxID=67364 RepID=UPI0037931EA8